jgi:hypothetical protein
MKQICWWLVDVLSETLEPDERDAVRGDFAESGESGGQALRGLIGLAVRRQAALWKDWRPWVAPIGLLAPVVCGGFGIGWIAWQFRCIWTHGVRYEVGMPVTDDLVRLVCCCILPIAWAWSGGFVLGGFSRRAVWTHPALISPLLALSGGLLYAHGLLFWLLPIAILMPIPFLWGVRRGARGGTFRIGLAVWLAAALAISTLAVQVEDGRASLAFAAWSGGGAVDGRLAWTPRLLPFAAIVWQFGLIFATRRRSTHEWTIQN